MKQNGWRKPTPGLGVAEKLAQAGEELTVSRSQAILACKRVAAHIGLKAGDILILDTLCAFSRPQDWDQSRRPIVWPSNAFLMEQTGYSLSSLKRHTRRLTEAGVIAVRDSPNGKRWGHRDTEGHIIEAYGFDLGPLAARAQEFTNLFETVKAERQICARVKRQITIQRRTIRAKLEANPETFPPKIEDAITMHFGELLSQLPHRAVTSEWLINLLNKFTLLGGQLEQLLQNNSENQSQNTQTTTSQTPEMTPRKSEYDPHIQTTNKLISLRSTQSPTNQPSHLEEQSSDQSNEYQRAEAPKPILLEIVLKACPEFTQIAQHLGTTLKDWNQMHRIAGKVRPMIGMTEQAWSNAQEKLGPKDATAAMALIFDKFAEGKLKSPGGYLRGMVKKAETGALHLERSFYKRLRQMET